MKKFLVLFLSQEEWDEPTVKFINAKNEDEAYDLGLIEIGYSQEEVEEAQDRGVGLQVIVREVI